ncbi:TPA: terminase small subunit [Streptococcus pneumoniae]
MNERQRRFADEYIISRNATQSAIKVGYSEKTAYSIGQRLLKNVEISEYIKKRTEELFDERSMSIVEALAISASIARGETQQGYSKKTVKNTVKNDEGVKVSETTYEFTPTIEERQRSLDHIFRVNGAYLERKEIEMSSAVQFVDDIGVGDEA